MCLVPIIAIVFLAAFPILVYVYHRRMNGKYRIIYIPHTYIVQRYYPEYVSGGFDPADASYDWDWHTVKRFATLEEAKAFLEQDKAEYLAECAKPKSKSQIVYRD